MTHAGAGAASVVTAAETGGVTVAGETRDAVAAAYAHGANDDDGNRDAAAADKSSTVTNADVRCCRCLLLTLKYERRRC